MEVGIVVHRYNFIVKSISTATSQIPLGGKPSYLEETGPRIEACRLDTTFILKANKSALFETYCACSWATIASTGRLPRQGLLWVLSKVTYTWPSLQVPQVSTEGRITVHLLVGWSSFINILYFLHSSWKWHLKAVVFLQETGTSLDFQDISLFPSDPAAHQHGSAHSLRKQRPTLPSCNHLDMNSMLRKN